MRAQVTLFVRGEWVRRNIPRVEHDDESDTAPAVVGTLQFEKLCELIVGLVPTLTVQESRLVQRKMCCQTIWIPLQAHLLHALDHILNIARRDAESLHERRPTNVGLNIINFA